jgi:CPA1 family monovalent cation:H+ antiporter
LGRREPRAHRLGVPGANLRPLLLRKVREREGFPIPRAVFIVGWAGLRGSVTMAAALSIPLVIGNGRRSRDAIS